MVGGVFCFRGRHGHGPDSHGPGHDRECAAISRPRRGGPVVLDGELVADAGLASDSYRVGGRVRSSGTTGDVTFVAFDLLVVDGETVCAWPDRERRAALESLGLSGPAWCTIRALDAGTREVLETVRVARCRGRRCETCGQPVSTGCAFRRLAETQSCRVENRACAHAASALTAHPRGRLRGRTTVATSPGTARRTRSLICRR